MKTFKEFIIEQEKQDIAEELNRRGFLKGLGAVGGAMALGATSAHASDFADAAAKGLYYGATSSVAGSAIYKKQNAEDMAFADKIPDEWDRTRYMKAVKSVIRSRNDSAMRYAGHDGSMSRGSIVVAERQFNRLKVELSQKYKIPLDQVK
jgi:TAT (twin-arginine translocation) pathway signal sequence